MCWIFERSMKKGGTSWKDVPHRLFYKASPSGEAVARRRLMRGRFADAARMLIGCESSALIRLLLASQPPSPEGEGKEAVTYC